MVARHRAALPQFNRVAKSTGIVRQLKHVRKSAPFQLVQWGLVCTASAFKCGGLEVETTVLKCNASQTEYKAVSYCSDTETQCNPATGICIKLGLDATEITRDQYSNFNKGTPPKQEGVCATINSSFAPDASCMAKSVVCAGTACGDHPQVCVDWCDAVAFCNSQGKTLCGRIGGGMNPFDRFDDPGSSIWMNACSAGGQYKYGSGARVDSGPQYCNYVGTQLGTTLIVTDVLDSSGADACRTRGGSFASALGALACDTVPASALRRDAVSPEVGFRCCSK